MLKRTFILALIFLTACASQRPKDATNYQTDLIYPQETENFVVQKLHVFDEPLLGALLGFVDKQYPQDIISVYVYPVPTTDWNDEEETLNLEMDRVMEEIDYSIKTGRYISRTDEERQRFDFPAEGKEYTGLKVSMDLVLTDEQRLNSNAYLFIAQDKFIKFRTSFLANENIVINGDKAVREILPGLVVPPESAYMKKIREEHKRQQQEAFLNLLLKAMRESGKNNNENHTGE